MNTNTMLDATENSLHEQNPFILSEKKNIKIISFSYKCIS